MDEESNIYGTVVKRTVMEEGVDYSKGASCRHSSDTIHYTKKPGRWSHTLLVSVAFLTLGGSIPIGYICGISTNSYHVEDAWVRLPMTTLRQLLLVGSVAGAMFAAVLADWAGRRWTTVMSQVAGTVGALTHLLASLTQSELLLVVAWLALGLFVVMKENLSAAGWDLFVKERRDAQIAHLMSWYGGHKQGMAASVLPLYLVELAPLPCRMSLGAVYSVGTALGLMLSETLGLHCALASGSGHPFLVPMFLLPVIISWFFFLQVPESPAFLYFIKNDTTSAAVELVKLRGREVTSVKAEFSEGSLNKETEDFTFCRLLKHPMLLILLSTAHLSQALGESDQLNHLTGARPRLVEADVVVAGYTASVINCIIALLVVQLISTMSWRLLLVTSSAASSALLLLMAALGLCQDANGQTVYLMLVTLLVQVIVFDLGLRPIPCFLACELFEAKASATMMAVGAAVNFLCQLASDQVFLYLGVPHFRVFTAIFLAVFVVLLLISPSPSSKDQSPQEKVTASPKANPAVCHLPNPHWF